jgi:glycosyltransferase involved in cell wall biosynthesis
MRVIALTEGPDHVCYRYRIKPFAQALAERGFTLEVVPLVQNTLRRVRQLRSVRGADVVILQRKRLPIWQTVLLRRSARRMIYDIDDALFQRDTFCGKSTRSWRRLSRFWAAIYAADAVTVGNRFLGEVAGRYVGAEKVHVIPTCVDPALYPVAGHERAGAAAKLVWIGQKCTFPVLQCAGPQLAAATARLPGLEFRIVSNYLAEIPGVNTVLRTWSSATETAELADADIGISWLPDDTWTRGKCGLKVLQFMAAGLPVVTNPVGVHPEMVIHGETGFLATTAAEWAEAIERLARDPALRRRLGAAGRRLVQERYSVAAWGQPLAELIERVARGPASESRAAA